MKKFWILLSAGIVVTPALLMGIIPWSLNSTLENIESVLFLSLFALFLFKY